MSLKENLEEKIQKTQLKMKELAISLEQLKFDYQKLVEELALSPEQLKEYVENSENFSPPIWKQLQEEKKQLDEKLNLELNQVRDPLQIKKTFSEKGNVQQHWLFVR